MAKKLEETSKEVERDFTGPRSMSRLLGLFGALSQARDGLSLADLNAVLDSPKSSLLNLLRPLVSEGYLLHSNGYYRLGPSIFRLSASVLAAWNFPKQIRPYMEELSSQTEETVLLGVSHWEAEVITYVEIINSHNPVRYQVPVGTTRPLYVTTAGRLLLAYTDKKRQDNYLKSVTFKLRTAASITRTYLKHELEKIRTEGLSYSQDIALQGVAAIAAPVFDANGSCVAALSIAGPTDRFNRDLESLKEAVKKVAARASGFAGGEYEQQLHQAALAAGQQPRASHR